MHVTQAWQRVYHETVGRWHACASAHMSEPVIHTRAHTYAHIHVHIYRVAHVLGFYFVCVYDRARSHLHSRLSLCLRISLSLSLSLARARALSLSP
jgi:hypothetical protein